MEIYTCNKCGQIVETDTEIVSDGYTAYCPDCDEDLYEIEITKES
ncbi:MAG: hypothetical protein ACRDD8_09610 [Bacteroidales bacterium]